MSKKGEVVQHPFFHKPSEVSRYRLTIKGTERLLMDHMPANKIETDLIRRERNAPDLTLPLKDMAQRSLYRDPENRICIPSVNMLACLREAGKRVKWGSSKSNVTRADNKTTLFAFLSIEEPCLVLDVPKTGVDNEGWTPDLRQGRLPDGTACGIVRPCFQEWGFAMHVQVDKYTSEVTKELVAQLFFIAGKAVGLCAFRPTCGGPFGTFKVVDSKEIAFGEKVLAAA